MAKYEVFIEGELMDLCYPAEKAIYEDGWHLWFNDPKITRYLKQGIFPNTAEDQLEYLELLRKSEDRLLLLIKPKKLDKVVGVVCLSNIDFISKMADFVIVIGDRKYKARYKEIIGMEAKCRSVEHAFEVMGLQRINGAQAADLRMWQRWQVLLGGRVEGFFRKYFHKGLKTSDAIYLSILLEDYLKLKKLRGGSFWPGAKRLMELIRLLPKESFDQKVEKILNQEWAAYYDSLTLA